MSRTQLCNKLSNLLSCSYLTKDQMICSSYAASQFLKQHLRTNPNHNKNDKKNEKDDSTTIIKEPYRVHVIGSDGLCAELQSSGFHVTGGQYQQEEKEGSLSSSSLSSMSRDQLASYSFPEHPTDAIVVGLDIAFNYRKLCIANVLLQWNPNCLFVATNKDTYDLAGADARHLPGNGSIVQALEYSSGRKAIDVGKPSSTLAQLLSSLLQENDDDDDDDRTSSVFDFQRTLMVGDRLDTDIRFGIENGMGAALVLTGCTTSEQIIQMYESDNDDDDVQKVSMPTVIFPYVGMISP